MKEYPRVMPFLLGLVFSISLATSEARAGESYTLDPGHSAVLFEIDHFGFSKVFGRFDTMSGKITLDEGNLTASSVVITIDAGSLSTGVADRDDHLRSPDFFNAAEFPKIEFRSTGVESAGKGRARISGDLTLLGTTLPVTLEAKLNRVAPHPMRPGVTVAGFSASTTIDRTDFGMKYGEGGIGSEVVIRMEIEAHRK
jgi:polyisoprenoid-binding protein YceI